MLSALLLPLTLIAAPVPKIDKVDDGIYRVLEKGKGSNVIATDGRNLQLGDRLATQYGKPSIYSLDNANTRFGLNLLHAPRIWDGDEQTPLALVVDGVVMPSSGHSVPHDDGTRDHYFPLNGLEAAKRAAAVLKIEPTKRKHPGHSISVVWKPAKGSFAPGEPVELTMELTNNGKEPVSFRAGGQQRGQRDNQYRFIAQASHGSGKGLPDVGDPNHFGGMSSIRTLKPGETFTAKVDVAKWFKFEAEDIYRVTGIWELQLEDPDRPGFARGIWDDLAAGECMVKIAKLKK